MTLSTNVYEDPEDREAAIEMARDIVAKGRRRPSSADSSVEQYAGGEQHSVEKSYKLAHNFVMRFMNTSSKFRGDIGKFWQEFIHEYRQVSRYYRLFNQQKLDYLYNLLYGDAKRFYLDSVYGYAQSFQEVVDTVEREYNSIVRQN